jgi:hypothetical protein
MGMLRFEGSSVSKEVLPMGVSRLRSATLSATLASLPLQETSKAVVDNAPTAAGTANLNGNDNKVVDAIFCQLAKTLDNMVLPLLPW